MRLRAASLLTVALAATALAGAGAATAAPANGPTSTVTAAGSGRCAPTSSRKVAGTLLGKDGLALDATIGFDLQDSSGRAIDARTGCAARGYGAIVQLNHYVGADGAAVGSEMTSAQGADEGKVDPTFSVDLPANVARVYVETYTRAYTGSPCGLPCAGRTDNTKYGNVNRMQVPAGKVGHLNLVADTTQKFHGDAGAIQVFVPSTGATSVHAWSMAIKGGPNDEGWGTGTRSSSNPHLWTIPALSPGQEYTMIVGGYPQKYHIKVAKDRTTKVTA